MSFMESRSLHRDGKRPSRAIFQPLPAGFCIAIVIGFLFVRTGDAGIYGGTKPVPGPTIEDGKVKPLSFGQFRLYFTQYTVDLIKPASPLQDLCRRSAISCGHWPKRTLKTADARSQRSAHTLRR